MRESDSCTPVVCRMLVRLIVAEGVDRPVLLDLSYDRADPYAVSLTFHMCTDTTVRWVVGRELLLDGLEKLTGVGDIQIWPCRDPGADRVHIALCPWPKRKAVVVTAPARTLGAFLRRTLAVVPTGTEERHLNMDGAVHQLLGGPDESLR
ncbi:SsgA family sporulation/cell division regulator [Streptomyces sp. WI04-05B]|uniref:SsgA family sporulation/cell division regulator n=1 Tax=Streptomyces TaxID=1883 RepID=UPI0029B4439C|nr:MULTISPECIES: SsgA family sporulation/cell division regulator [unclassified Streptomyces]MDX2546260.1 SsgA family sporulation/cell division regulator [Streptomyces sp. WI04-05B]MDX2583283.1 SsgA family sporulation/cell division regulator [Streptomyces sp. WI04-05A]